MPGEIKSELQLLQSELKQVEYRFIRWVASESIHLTLKFLGNVSRQMMGDISESVRKGSQGVSPFKLGIGELGVFPDMRSPRVLWVGIHGDLDKLRDLQQGIDSALVPLGFTVEKRPFTPHLTLARLREGTSPVERQSFGKLVMNTTFDSKYEIPVKSLSLMQSQLSPSGAVYSRLDEIEL